MIKAITIKQPWATLIALGEKKFETRSWPTKHRGPVAIHAGKAVDKRAYNQFAEILAKHGFHSMEDLPSGAVIATATIVDCHRVIENPTQTSALTDKGITISEQEFQMGYYGIDYCAWELNSIHKLTTPLPAKGKLSLWQFPDL